MGPLGRFLDLIRNPSYSRTTSLLVILIIALSIPLTVFVAQKQQEIRQQAAVGACNPSDPCTGWSYTSCTTSDGQQGHQASCGGNTDPTCYQGPAPDLATLCAKPATPAPTPTQTPATQAPATSAPRVGGPACGTPPFTIGSCTAADQAKGPIPNASCERVCPAGTAKAGQKVTGTSAKECQSNLCWYDSYFDPSPAKAPKEQWCYGIPGQPDPCSPTIATAGQCSNQGGSCDPGTSCGINGRTINLGTCGSGILCCKGPTTATPTPAQGVSCTEANVRCPANCSATTLPNGNWQCYTNATVFTANKVACEPTTCASAPGATAAPGATSTPTPSPGANDTIFALTIGLNGLGITGDSKNPSSFNPTPRKTTRTFKVEVFDSGGTNKITEKSGSLSLSGGRFTGNINMGVIANGTYVVRVKTDGFVKKRIPATINITTAGQTINLSSVNLPNGDMSPNESIDALDYNILLGCIFKTFSSSCEIADLDDNGQVDQFDYNLFLREFSQSGD